MERLRRAPGVLLNQPEPADGPLGGDDFHLSLYICYQLHHRGFADVDDEWEWSPSLLAVRRSLEARFERTIQALVPKRQPSKDIASDLQQSIDADPAPSLSSYLETAGTPEEFREFVIHRSVYQLQEADPHTWAIPRLHGASKAALITIQADEYGNGRYADMHSTLFESAMKAFDLDVTYGKYVDHVPGATLATLNLMTMFGLNRRWVGALVGHLAVFEMTSTVPNLRYGNALRRFGYGAEATRFYDEHVTADETHGRIASHDLAGSFVRQSPERAADVLLGAGALLLFEGMWAERLLNAWRAKATSLYRPLPVASYA